MDQQQVKTYLLAKPLTQLTHPFGEDVAVFKVKHKMFATLSYGKMGKGDETNEDGECDYWLNLKCDPDEAIMLRDIFPAIIPGYHMNKRLWNTVILDGTVPQGEIERMIDNSFNLVVENMPKSDQQAVLVHL